MSDFKDRLITEMSELTEKTNKLNVFIGSNPDFKGLPVIQKELLKVQLMAMETYLRCIQSRINNL